SKLAKYVRAGGGLAIVPGGDEMFAEAYRNATADTLLPGEFKTLIKISDKEKHILWALFDGQDELTRPFRDWIRAANPDFARADAWPFVNVYWRVEPGEFAAADFADGKKSPALLARNVNSGRVVQFTAPLDARTLPGERPWHNYWSDSSFGLVLVDRVCSYLVGASNPPTLNFVSGQPAVVALPNPPPRGPLTLYGPEPSATEARLTTEEGRLTIAGATDPGNYQIRDSKNGLVAAFSIAIRGEESDLSRVPVEEIEALLGKGAVLPAERRATLHELLQGRWTAPMELFPWLMMLLLLVLTAEGLLASRFYRRAEAS
ncbi:MAG: hypothetical protein ACRD36_06860, partial [Candidatus Acidiferrum sp.]